MKLIITLAILSGLLLALFLWLRPVIGSRGTPTQPNVRGRASNPAPDGTLGGAVIAGPPASTIGPAIPRPGAADVARAGVTHADQMEGEILALVNQERAKVKAGSLQSDPTLQVTARGHSDDMFVRGFFGHDDPDGLSAADRIAKAHRQMIGLTGENIWMGVNLDLTDRKKVAAMIMNDWMRSLGHRTNILKQDYTHLGVGVAVKGRDVRATQNFAAVYALTNQAVPALVRDGQGLDLVAKPISASAAPDQFEFFASDKGLAVGGARAITGATVKNVPAGVYKLRFLFPRAGGHVIYWGPWIEVK